MIMAQVRSRKTSNVVHVVQEAQNLWPECGPLTWTDSSGCKTLRLDKVLEHKNSKYHAEAVMLKAESIRRPLENNIAEVVSNHEY